MVGQFRAGGSSLPAAALEELLPILAADAEPAEYSPGHLSEASVVRQGFGDVDEAFHVGRLAQGGDVVDVDPE